MGLFEIIWERYIGIVSARMPEQCSWTNSLNPTLLLLNPTLLFYFLCLQSITKTRVFKYIETFCPQKTWNFQIKKSDIFYISAQNIHCGYSLEPLRWGGSNEYPQSMFAQNIYCGYSLEPLRRGGSNEYPQSMFLSRNKKNNLYPFKPDFYYIKVGLNGVKIILVRFCDGLYCCQNS